MGKAVVSRWEDQVGRYSRYADSALGQAVLARQMAALGIGRDEAPLRILEIGCGTGRLSITLASMGHTVVSVDSSLAMLAEGRGRHGLPAPIQAECSRLPFRAASFDVVVGIHVLHHCKGDGALEEAVGEVFRVLSEGGRFLVCDRNYAFLPRIVHRAAILIRSALAWVAPGRGFAGPPEPDLDKADYARIIGERFRVERLEFAWCIPTFLMTLCASFADCVGLPRVADALRQRLGRLARWLESRLTWGCVCLDRCYVLRRSEHS